MGVVAWGRDGRVRRDGLVLRRSHWMDLRELPDRPVKLRTGTCIRVVGIILCITMGNGAVA